MANQFTPDQRVVTEARLPVLAEELGIGGSGSGSGVEEVSGTVVLDSSGPAVREFWSTGATTFQANGTDTLISSATGTVWRRTASGSWGYQVVPDEWTTPAPTPDTTAPAAGTLAASVTDVKADLTVSGASDNRGYVQYSFSKDNGATWTGYQDAAAYSFTGLTSATPYQFRHRVKDAAGNVTTGTAVSRSTNAAPPAVLKVALTDTFTGVDGAFSSTHTTTDTGQAWTGSTGATNIASNRASLFTANAPVYVNHGATAREVTVDAYFPAVAGAFLLWAWHGGAAGDLSSPRAYVGQNGQVSLNNITQTYNASGGTGGATPVGYLTLAVGTAHAVKVTYDGARVALYVNGTRIIEGTPTSALTGTYAAFARTADAAVHADNLNVKVVA